MEAKRKIFFTIIGVLFFVFYGALMLHPVLKWADAATVAGQSVLGIPMTLFLIWLCCFALAILIAITFYVDTRVLVEKENEK